MEVIHFDVLGEPQEVYLRTLVAYSCSYLTKPPVVLEIIERQLLVETR